MSQYTRGTGSVIYGFDSLDSSVNLYDKNLIEPGYFKYDTGVWTVAAKTHSSHFIRVFGGCTYEKSCTGSLCLFDTNKNFISGVSDSKAPYRFTVKEADAAYAVIAFDTFSCDPDTITFRFISGPSHSFQISDDYSIEKYERLIEENRILKRMKGRIANCKTYLRIPTPYDDGAKWSGYMNQATHPSIVQFDTEWNGYKYWMAFTPYPYSLLSKENPCIAASNDCLTWVVPAGVTNPLVDTPEEGYNSDTHLSYNSAAGCLELWYRKAAAGIEVIYRISSPDGTAWSEPEIVISSDLEGLLNYISPSIVYEDCKYRMWVSRNYKLFLLESTDGAVWTDVGYLKSENVEIHNCWHPNVVKINSIYYLINCSKNTNVGPGGELKYAVSADGVNWSEERYLLSYTGNEFDYDGVGVYRGSIVIEDDNVILLYGQYSADGKWTIGMSKGRSIDNLVGIDDRAFAGDIPFISDRKRVFYKTDFFNNNRQQTPWNTVAINGGSTLNGPGTADHPGLIRLNSSPLANSGIYLMTNPVSMVLGGGECHEIIFKTLANDPAITGRMGFFDTLTYESVSNGAWLEISGAVLTGKTSAASTASTTASTYALAAGAWYRATIEVDQEAALVTFTLYPDNSEIPLWRDALATNIPSAECGNGVLFISSGITESALVYIDYMSIEFKRVLAR